MLIACLLLPLGRAANHLLHFALQRSPWCSALGFGSCFLPRCALCLLTLVLAECFCVCHEFPIYEFLKAEDMCLFVTQPPSAVAFRSSQITGDGASATKRILDDRLTGTGFLHYSLWFRNEHPYENGGDDHHQPCPDQHAAHSECVRIRRGASHYETNDCNADPTPSQNVSE
jgi:hypothetical protein